MVYVTVAHGWVQMLWSATCSRNPCSFPKLMENTGDLSFLKCGNIALRCFIKLGGKENGGLEIICISLFSNRC